MNRGSAACGADFVGNSLTAFRLHIRKPDRGAFFGKQASDRFADAGRRSADPRDLILQSICHCSNHF